MDNVGKRLRLLFLDCLSAVVCPLIYLAVAAIAILVILFFGALVTLLFGVGIPVVTLALCIGLVVYMIGESWSTHLDNHRRFKAVILLKK